MKKFKKIILASALALSSLAFVPVSENQQASAAPIDWAKECKNSDTCDNYINYYMRVNQELFGGYSRLEIKSGSGIVSITPSGYLKANKRGTAVVYAYDRNDRYSIIEVVIQ
ncbi:hypothetical protein [Lysinibacillus capsici]|uniref:Group-specific protein n=1 Tax=Lysinibacillus capsici TaxID=2115968 RepID=A0A2X0Y3Y9_9BACI|nr:hypothetical protein [Lysinibacillus capsici]SPU00748.1 Uncharacterised protein [Lysinibacillus capsici]